MTAPCPSGNHLTSHQTNRLQEPMSMGMTSEPPAAGRLALDRKIFYAWREDHEGWEGSAQYADLETAKAHAAADYRNDEYGYPDDDEPTPVPAFTWAWLFGSWHLYAGGVCTDVQVTELPVLRPATSEEITEQDAAAEARAMPCPAGLPPTGSEPMDWCIVRGAHQEHRAEYGRTWTDADSGVA